MEAYPSEYTSLPAPLVFLSGLGERQDDNQSLSPAPRHESGTRIVTTSAECQSDRAAQLLDQLLRHDGSRRAWNSTAQAGPNGGLKYRMKPIGRTLNLPPRKAAPLPQSPSTDGLTSQQPVQHRSTELHSPLSPLSPGSPIYPDGVFTPQWMAKHQEQVPALLIAFFEISSKDSGTSQNEQIQIDINAIRAALSRSGFKTKFAAVLMSDESILHAPELEDRLAAIRRATTLDLKTGLFFMPPMSSQVEIANFVEQVLLAPLQPFVTQYYRDLTTHSRRKKARGGPTASTGAHALSTPGWNVRYEVKQGVFAEYRQEMDVAERHFSQAIEELFVSEGVLEATPSWSPRWGEARLLCDVLAYRTLRCQLFSRLTTGAAVSWVNYRARVKDLIDRRGIGSQTYGFDAWESRWAEIMAQLIQHTALPAFQPLAKQTQADATELPRLLAYAPWEKAERLPPFHQLHHPGYWKLLAFRSAQLRFAKAREIPMEDRTPPGQSPASVVAHRSKNYDVYLVPEPDQEYPLPGTRGYGHIADMRRLANEAALEFTTRGQARSAAHVKLELAHELAQALDYAQALDVVLPLWEDASWRREDWDDPFSSMLNLVHECADHANNAEVHLASAWELLCVERRPAAMSDHELLDYVGRHQPSPGKVVVNFENMQRLSPVSASFAFVDKDTHIGELVECQLTLGSQASKDSSPVTLSRVQVVLSDSKTIVINHNPSASPILDIETLLDLSGTTPADGDTLSVEADLALRPRQKRIYSFFPMFRDAAVVRLEEVLLVLEDDRFCLEHKYTDDDLLRTLSVYTVHGNLLEQRLLSHLDTTAVTVLPKPPKMRVSLHGLSKRYYANERIHLEFEAVNEEPETVHATAALHILGNGDAALNVEWDSERASQDDLTLGNIAAAASYKTGLTVVAPAEPCTFILEVQASYTLESDSGTPLTKTLTADMEVIVALDAKYNLSPLLQPGPWPSYFDTRITRDEEPEGIPQRWLLGSRVRSLAPDKIVIHAITLAMDSVADDTACTISDQALPEQQTLEPEQSTAIDFEFVTRKSSLDDRRPANLEFSLVVTWCRAGDNAGITTKMEVPRLALPSSEPRVLCTYDGAAHDGHDGVIHYYLENPSTHFLTFALTMEASESFAFSGPKYRTLSLAPLSRLCVDYDVSLHDQEPMKGKADDTEGRWIWPVLQVLDLYYSKNLRVHSGGARVKVDEKRGLGIMVAED